MQDSAPIPISRTKPRRVRDQVADLIRRLVESQQVTTRHRILCYGCGPGVDVEWLRARNFSADGYDTYAPYGYATPPAGKYDCIFMVYLLRRLGRDAARREAIADAAQHLRPGGRLFIVSRNAHGLAAAAGYKTPAETRDYFDSLFADGLFDQRAPVEPTGEDGAYWYAARRGGLHLPANPIVYVDDQPGIAQACGALSRYREIGLDVETTLDEPRRLCTIQLGVPDRTWVFDALAVQDFAPIKAVLENRGIEKVIHNALFEEQMLGKHGIRIANVFDTLTSSRAKHRRGSIEGGHHLAAVCERELGIYLDKTLQTSDWTQRPLSAEQLAYAALDAEVLLDLHRVFKPPKPPENLELFPSR